VFGENKTVRGFVVMVPAAALIFMILGALARAWPDLAASLWPLTPRGFAALGAWAALGFMLGELPNSIVKRQLDIAPGEAPRGRTAATIGFVVDRLDSIVGMLTAVTLVVPTSLATWVWVLVLGPTIHWSFSVLLYRLGVKARPARRQRCRRSP
jgi:CDP-diglyceride synthetase